jgi:phage tail-like protein
MSSLTKNFSFDSMLPELLRYADTDQEIGEGAASAVARLLDVIAPMFADLDTVLNDIPEYFDPLLANEEFLPWLASWTALVLRADWSLEQKRKALSQIIPLYRKRGTKAGLEEYLKIYVGEGVTIFDEHQPMQVGATATVGQDFVIGGLPAYFFRANVAFTTPDPAELSAKTESVRAVLDIEKPAHTSYKLTTSGPTFQINVRSTVGKDTLI